MPATAKKKSPAKKNSSKAAADSGKKLLIVESPAKAKTLSKFLGSEFVIKASLGHIRDLPQKGNSKKGLGIDIENDFTPDYQIIPGKEKTVQELKSLAKKSSEIFLAPDPDREGESIAWHLAVLLELIGDPRVHRVTYGAITKKAVLEAISKPRSIDMNLVNAQQGRRILDRLVGFNLSPFLWKKVAMNLSAGRVQSVAVRLVVERERAIRAFVPEEYWKLSALLSAKGQDAEEASFQADLVEWDGQRFALGSPIASSEAPVKEIVAHLEEASFQLLDITKKETKRSPAAPFITSTLQQSASNMFGFGPSRTMGLAQKLYEGVELGGEGSVGLITYMRTDSVRIEPEAIEELRSYIGRTYPAEYLASSPRVFGSKGNAQDAHEAIRPTSMAYTPEFVKNYLDRDSFRLYQMIWNRFVASQMTEARYALTSFQIQAAKGIFESKGRILLFDGFTRLWLEQEEGKNQQDDQRLPDLSAPCDLDKKELNPSQHFTKPPSRYTEAGLVKALEKEGIGRPSTYAPIIKTIKDRGYVSLEKRSFRATELGMAVTEVLQGNFPDVMDYKFTASMEEDLDKIEQGKTDWIAMMKSFYGPFHSKVEHALEHAEALKGRPYEGTETCPLCQSSMVIRYSKSGAFLSCSQYPECKGLRPMPGENSGENEDIEPVDCPECGRPMLVKTSRFGKKFMACSGYPECKTTQPLPEEAKAMPQITHDCEDCGSPMQVKSSRQGYFLGCSKYPECKNTHPLDADGNIIFLPKIKDVYCEKCGSEMAVKMSRRGPFLACTGYPKCRNAKPLPKEGEELPKAKAAAKKTAAKKAAAKKTAAKKTAAKKSAAKKAAAKKTAAKKTVENAAELSAAKKSPSRKTPAKKAAAKKAAAKKASTKKT